MAPRSYWARRYLSWRFLRGEGLEIGALHKPLPVPSTAKVRYVDRFSVDELRTHYPELAQFPLVNPDIVDDGETLSSTLDGSVDFIIANHFLEHCEDPIGALKNHLDKLRRGGVLYLAIPLRDFTFDRDRPVTSLQHLHDDFTNGPEGSRRSHYLEWAALVNKAPAERVEEEADRLMRERYSIHFHVWDHPSFVRFLQYLMQEIKLPFTIAAAVSWRYNPLESVFVLRRR